MGIGDGLLTMVSWRDSSFRLWIAILLVPALVNGLLWIFFVNPQQTKREVLRSAQAAADMKPVLESLLKESHKILFDGKKTVLPEGSPSAGTTMLQQLATR